jgi:hypothetical protein
MRREEPDLVDAYREDNLLQHEDEADHKKAPKEGKRGRYRTMKRAVDANDTLDAMWKLERGEADALRPQKRRRVNPSEAQVNEGAVDDSDEKKDDDQRSQKMKQAGIMQYFKKVFSDPQ